MSACIWAYRFFSAATCASAVRNLPVKSTTSSCSLFNSLDCAAFSASRSVIRSPTQPAFGLRRGLPQKIAQYYAGQDRHHSDYQSLHLLTSSPNVRLLLVQFLPKTVSFRITFHRFHPFYATLFLLFPDPSATSCLPSLYIAPSSPLDLEFPGLAQIWAGRLCSPAASRYCRQAGYHKTEARTNFKFRKNMRRNTHGRGRES